MSNIYAKYLNESVLNEKFSKKEIRDLFFNYAMEKELNTNILLSGKLLTIFILIMNGFLVLEIKKRKI